MRGAPIIFLGNALGTRLIGVNVAFWLATERAKWASFSLSRLSALSWFRFDHKSFIDQACSAIMAEYRASFLRFYWPRLRLGSQKHTKNLAIIPNHLDLTLITHIHRLLWHNIHVIKIHGQKFTPPWSPWFESVKIFLFNMQLQMVTFFNSKFYCFRLHFIRGYSTSQWLRQIEDHWFHASLDFQQIWTVSAGILPGSCP